MADILVVDDEIGIRELLSEILGDEGHAITIAENAQQARKARDNQTFDLVLLDIWMPDTDGVTLLKEWAGGGKLTMPVIMMSGHATIDTAVEATRIGAMDFLEKPIAMQKLLRAVELGLNRNKIVEVASLPVSHSASSAAASAMNPTYFGATPSAPNVQAFLPVKQMMGAASLTLPQSPIQHIQGFGAMPQAAPSLASVVGMTMPAIGMPGAALIVDDLPLDLPLREARDAFERAYFEHHLTREHGSMTRVAERTGLERTHLYRKLKQLGIDLSRGAYRKSGT
jgi:DNA-binding NtrC family response regulator